MDNRLQHAGRGGQRRVAVRDGLPRAVPRTQGVHGLRAQAPLVPQGAARHRRALAARRHHAAARYLTVGQSKLKLKAFYSTFINKVRLPVRAPST